MMMEMKQFLKILKPNALFYFGLVLILFSELLLLSYFIYFSLLLIAKTGILLFLIALLFLIIGFLIILKELDLN